MLNGKQIREVTAQGIKYLDENNIEQFIDFTQCYENYLDESLSPVTQKRIMEINQMTDADWAKHVERVKNFKEVGARNILTLPWADGPFIEFYTHPRTRFKFDTQDEWDDIIEAIRIAKYKTFDLS